MSASCPKVSLVLHSVSSECGRLCVPWLKPASGSSTKPKHRSGALAPSLARIVPRIDLAAISAFIDDMPYLTDLQRQFYKTYLAARYKVMLESISLL